MTTLKEILEFENEFDEKFPENMGLAKVWRKEIKEYIHSRDKKLLMAVVEEIEKLRKNNKRFPERVIVLDTVSSLLQDLIK